jgi:hypothetical protein
MSADTVVDVQEQIPPVYRGDTSQEHFGGALMIELPTEDSIVLHTWN